MGNLEQAFVLGPMNEYTETFAERNRKPEQKRTGLLASATTAVAIAAAALTGCSNENDNPQHETPRNPTTSAENKDTFDLAELDTKKEQMTALKEVMLDAAVETAEFIAKDPRTVPSESPADSFMWGYEMTGSSEDSPSALVTLSAAEETDVSTAYSSVLTINAFGEGDVLTDAKVRHLSFSVNTDNLPTPQDPADIPSLFTEHADKLRPLLFSVGQGNESHVIREDSMWGQTNPDHLFTLGKTDLEPATPEDVQTLLQSHEQFDPLADLP